MKKIFELALVACTGVFVISSADAQTAKPVLNHVAVYVKDLQKSAAFYHDIIQIDTIPEPFHDGKHVWYSIGANSHLHLIQGATQVTSHDKNSHLCFSVSSLPSVIERLDKNNITYYSWAGEKKSVTHRVDGIDQIYFTDPDGYWIEINNDYPKGQ